MAKRIKRNDDTFVASPADDTGQPGSRRLGRSFYEQTTIEVARQLLGKVLVRSIHGRRLSGIVVEVEAYLSSTDEASHSHIGKRKRNAVMFDGPGRLYVYTIHAKHCLNVVTEPEGHGAAVLVRALEPLEGTDDMRSSRNAATSSSSKTRDVSTRELTTGPARLCQALSVDLKLNGVDLCTSSEIWLEEAPPVLQQIKWETRAATRIGISRSADLPLRFLAAGNHFVSGPVHHHGRKRDWSFLDHE